MNRRTSNAPTDRELYVACAPGPTQLRRLNALFGLPDRLAPLGSSAAALSLELSTRYRNLYERYIATCIAVVVMFVAGVMVGLVW